MEARCWSDYLCPWCYVGQDRDRIFAAAGVELTHLPFELHPEIEPAGRRISATGRLAPTFDRIEEACAAAGLPFRRPTRMPNTRRALETAEAVRRLQPDAFAAVHRGLFHAHFAAGEPIDDPDLLDEIVTTAGADASAVAGARADGAAARWVDASMAGARALGVASTPSWVVGDLVIPGALEPATLTRWLDRLVARQRSS